MCFYSTALDSLYDIYLIMLGCGHHFITFRLFSGVFQLCSTCVYFIDRKMQEQRSILFSSIIVQLHSCPNYQGVGHMHKAMAYGYKYI
jgi:hypothetical protein